MKKLCCISISPRHIILAMHTLDFWNCLIPKRFDPRDTPRNQQFCCSQVGASPSAFVPRVCRERKTATRSSDL